jgi:hypothetical protein
MVKNASTTSDWYIVDSMRGFTTEGSVDYYLFANNSLAEDSSSIFSPTATGFKIAGWWSSATVIYMAIRRPNKPPTTGTQVYLPRLVTEAMFNNTVDLGLTTDLIISRGNVTLPNQVIDFDRLRGMSNYLLTTSTAAEGTGAGGTFGAGQTSVTWGAITSASSSTIDWLFKRAPGFFDEVCYTGTGVATTQAHNLTVVPEMMIVKTRSNVGEWCVYSSNLGNTKSLFLSSAQGADIANAYWNSTTPTSSVFSIGTFNATNSYTYVAYLFATLAGISKVGSYTGNGGTQNIDCGFAAGARFVLVKRTNAAGDWFVWDTARGIVAANDPHLSLNTTAAEVTTDDSIDPYSAGFTVNQVAATNINVSSATYIYLAIA